MKSRMWFIQIPVVALFAGAFYLLHLQDSGDLESQFLRSHVVPVLKNISGTVVNAKFKLRGSEHPKNKIIIAAIDDTSLKGIGRWPWTRDYIGFLITKLFDFGAKVVGLDIVFAEPDVRVPEELAKTLVAQGMEQLVVDNETDPTLASVIQQFRDRLVLGWSPDLSCRPIYADPKECILGKEGRANFPPGFERFGVSELNLPDHFNPYATPVLSVATFFPNIALFSDPSLHQGSFHATVDPDGFIRRSSLVLLSQNYAFPSLPLEMARVGLEEDIKVSLGDNHKISELSFKRSGRKIPVNADGSLLVNFRGPANTFTYVPVFDILTDTPAIQTSTNRKIASIAKNDLFKDAYVLIGVTSLGLWDMRNFPFETETAGVEGHANILDNLLSGDPLTPPNNTDGWIWILSAMTVGALGFAALTGVLESLGSLLLFVAVFGITALLDQKVFFEKNIFLETSLLYGEIIAIFVVSLAIKYIMEERQKKFIHGAFGRYVSPKVVDTIVKDPAKLSLGGEKRELTILFSDIRGFTTLSERMDAKHLSKFLNDYLGSMTNIIVNEFHGTLDKYIGDAIMAFWGAPLDQPQHAFNACGAAVRMLEELNVIRKKFLAEYGIDVRVGIGLNTGVVSVGNMGSEQNFNYTVIGDHVNLASRVEGLTKYYGAGIVTTKFTIDQIMRSGLKPPRYRILDKVKVKGKRQSVELIEIMDREVLNPGFDLFEEARSCYERKEWDRAISLFEKSADLCRPSLEEIDPVSKLYIQRCKDFKQTPPPADWDGSWEMTSK